MGTTGVSLVATAGVVTALLGVAPMARSTDDGTWSSPVPLVSGSTRAGNPHVVVSVDGRRLTAIWSQLGVSKHIRAAASSDGGRTWTSSGRISQPKRSLYTQLVASADGRRVVAVWGRSAGMHAVQAVRSSDGGRTWSAPVRVSPRQQAVHGLAADLSADGKRAVVTWQLTDGPHSLIQGAVSRDGGSTWSKQDWLSRLTRRQQFPPQVAMSASGRRITASWLEFGDRVAYFTVFSDDAGRTWGRQRLLDRIDRAGFWGYLQGSILSPRLAMSAGGRRGIATWQVQTNRRIVYVARTADGGATWSRPRALVDVALDYSDRQPVPVTADDGRRVTVVFAGTDYRWSSRTSTDGGRTWLPAVDLPFRFTDQSFGPNVAADGDGTPSVLWSTDQLFSATQPTATSGWSAPVKVGPERYVSASDLAASADGRRLAAVWAGATVLASVRR